jgi:hypothetical protein
MTHTISRRRFLGVAAGTAAAGLVVLKDARMARGMEANDAVRVGLIGAAGRGRWFCDILTRTRGIRLVALCDVDRRKAQPSFEQLPDLPKFEDFRIMLDKMRDGLDGCVVATPDNTHAVASAAVIRAGKGVFTEKPLTLKVHESHVLRLLAREHKTATQMGNQGTSSQAFQEAAARIRAGQLGEVREAWVWKDGGGGGRPKVRWDEAPVPETLNWDLWLGPAKARPYHPAWMQWHGWREFGSGELGNWGSHSANLPFKALGCDALWRADPASKPRLKFRAEASDASEERYPAWWVNHWSFPASEGLPPATIHWVTQNSPAFADLKARMLAAGVQLNDRGQPAYDGSHHTGCFIQGPKGCIVASSHNMSYKFLPADKGEVPPAPDAPRSRGHEMDWALAIRGGPPAAGNYEYSGPLNEMLMLGNVSNLVANEDLEYDPLECKVTNNAAADALVRREYRQGWTL